MAARQGRAAKRIRLQQVMKMKCTAAHLALGCSVQEWLWETGVEPHPGPIRPDDSWIVTLVEYEGIDLGGYQQVGGAGSSGGSGGGSSKSTRAGGGGLSDAGLSKCQQPGVAGSSSSSSSRGSGSSEFDSEATGKQPLGRGSAARCGPLTTRKRRHDAKLSSTIEDGAHQQQLDGCHSRFSPWASTFRPLAAEHQTQRGDEEERCSQAAAAAARRRVQPGDEMWQPKDDGIRLVIDSINVTALSTNAVSLLAREAHVLGIQEHLASAAVQPRFRAEAKDEGWDLDLGPIDPEHAKPSAGVGLAVRKPMNAIPIAGSAKDYNDAYETGRLAIYQLDVQGRTLLIAVIYGWTGACAGNGAAERSEDLMHILANELRAQPVGPQLIMGDFNGELEDFPTLITMTQEEGWTDVGAQAYVWGGQTKQTTCKVNRTAEATRRDFMLANEFLLPSIEAFRVHASDEFPTHSPLQLSLCTTKLSTRHRQLRKPDDAAKAWQDKVAEAGKDKAGKDKTQAERACTDQLHSHMDL